jgi:hypothetical protein
MKYRYLLNTWTFPFFQSTQPIQPAQLPGAESASKRTPSRQYLARSMDAMFATASTVGENLISPWRKGGRSDERVVASALDGRIAIRRLMVGGPNR